MMTLSSRALAYFVLRLAMGISMLVHGLNRLMHMPAFVAQISKQFAETWLPSAAVTGFADTVGPVEFVIGILVLLGLFTRIGLLAGGIWMVILIFGSAVIENYAIVGLQLTYSLIFAVLLAFLEENQLSLDAVLERRTARR